MDSCVAKIPCAERDGKMMVGEGVKFERIRRIALLSMPVRLALLANGHGASRRPSVATGYPAWMRGVAQRSAASAAPLASELESRAGKRG